MLGHCLPRLALLCAALAIGGCGAQADSSYRGEPLGRLRGSVKVSASSGLRSAPPPLDAALLWNGLPLGADAKASVARPQSGTSTPVSGQFPAQFELQLLTPPPESMLFSCFEGDPSRAGRVATAGIVAIRRGVVGSPSATDLYGRVDDLFIVYADADLPAVSGCPVGAVAKGYHLFSITPAEDKPGCVRRAPDDPSCNGAPSYTEVPLSTELTLTLAHDDGTASPPGPVPAPGENKTTPAPTAP